MMAVLVYLAESCGKSVSREELEQVVWQGTVVGYDALTSTINKLRKALGDDSNQPSYIKTIPKKGYCLIAAVKLTDEETTSSSEGKPRRHYQFFKWAIALVVLLSLAAVLVVAFIPRQGLIEARSKSLPTLVVLPFEDLNQESGQTYFSNGITADISTALSKLSGLFVISWSPTTSVPGETNDIRHIAKTLNVRYVLQGSVRRTDNRVRINAQLIDASSGVNLWAERYDREMKTVLDLQDEIATEIAAALSITLTEQEKLRQSRRYTTDIDAYDKFLQGQAAYLRNNREDNLLARHLYQSAIDKDSTFARAYGAMALTYANEYRFGWGDAPEQSLNRALQLANQAVAIDNQLPQAYWVLGYVHLQKRNYTESIAKSRLAIEVDPNNSDGYVMLALALMHDGDPESASRLVNKAMNLNPHYPAHYTSVLGQAYYYLGQYEEAIYLLRESAKRNFELITTQVYLVAALQKTTKHEEAAWEANQLKVSVPGFKVDNLAQVVPNKDPVLICVMQQLLREAGLD